MSRYSPSMSVLPFPALRLSVLSGAALACAFALAWGGPVHARQLGDISVVSVGPWEPHNTGGYTVCTAHLRRPNTSGSSAWEYHTVSANTPDVCFSKVQSMWGQGWSHNPNPGRPLCACTGGFHGYMTVTGNSGGPLGEAPLSEAGEALYHEGLQELRERYRIDDFSREHEQLLDAIRAEEPPQE